MIAILQRATVKPPNNIVHKKGFKYDAQSQTGAFSVSHLLSIIGMFSSGNISGIITPSASLISTTGTCWDIATRN